MFLSASAAHTTCEEVLVGGRNAAFQVGLNEPALCSISLVERRYSYRSPPVLVSVTRSQVGSSDGVPSGTVRPGGLVNDC